MAGFWGGVVNAAASGAAGVAQGQADAERRRLLEFARQEQLRRQQRADSIQNVDLAQRGVHLTAPGELPPQMSFDVSGGPSADDIITKATTHEAGGGAEPLTVKASRRLTVGDGYYVDQDERARNATLDAQLAIQQKLREAQGTAAIEDVVNPGMRQAKRDLTTAQVAKTRAEAVKAARADRPTSPPIGSPEWLAAERARADIAAGTHRTNRAFDVAHPMPQQETTKPTEFSNKAALVYPRAIQAAEQLDEFFTKGIPAKQGMGRVPGVGNYILSPAEQRAQQAAETISSAILRLESGAAISEHEVKEYARQFLPQAGDSPEVLQQKRGTLQTQLERMRQAAQPTLHRDAPPAVAPTRSGDRGDVDLSMPAPRPTTTRTAGAPPKAPAASTSLSDADLWEKFVNGGMSPEAATRAVQNRRRP